MNRQQPHWTIAISPIISYTMIGLCLRLLLRRHLFQVRRCAVSRRLTKISSQESSHCLIAAYIPARALSVAEASTAASDLIGDSTSWHSVASKLEVDGMFNINSTSVAAWTALLKHADGDEVPYTSVDLAADRWSVGLDSASGSPVSRTSIAGDPQANLDPTYKKSACINV